MRRKEALEDGGEAGERITQLPIKHTRCGRKLREHLTHLVLLALACILKKALLDLYQGRVQREQLTCLVLLALACIFFLVKKTLLDLY
jgi:hypothetical protein